MESSLSPDTSVTFCKPPSLGMQLLNYKKISQESVKEKSLRKEEKCKKTKSSRCMGCALCGNYKNYKNMVSEVNKIRNKKGKYFKLKDNLDCRNYGIYGAECLKCQEIYIGQTKNKFSTRWNSHRSKWKQFHQN